MNRPRMTHSSFPVLQYGLSVAKLKALLLLMSVLWGVLSVADARTVQGVLTSVVARKEKGQYLSSFAFHGVY